MVQTTFDHINSLPKSWPSALTYSPKFMHESIEIYIILVCTRLLWPGKDWNYTHTPPEVMKMLPGNAEAPSSPEFAAHGKKIIWPHIYIIYIYIYKELRLHTCKKIRPPTEASDHALTASKIFDAVQVLSWGTYRDSDMLVDIMI